MFVTLLFALTDSIPQASDAMGEYSHGQFKAQARFCEYNPITLVV